MCEFTEKVGFSDRVGGLPLDVEPPKNDKRASFSKSQGKKLCAVVPLVISEKTRSKENKLSDRRVVYSSVIPIQSVLPTLSENPTLSVNPLTLSSATWNI